MPSTAKVQLPTLTVGDFYKEYGEQLGLRLEGKEVGMDRRVREPTVNRPGLALSGFFKYFASKRIQTIGFAELSYLRSLPKAVTAERLKNLFNYRIPCIVLARNSVVPPILLRIANEAQIPVFRTHMITMHFINAATIFLESEFAPRCTEYGSMVDIHGIGTLIRGASGIGKSECVLGLIERGYSLVSDDITGIRFAEGRGLVGRVSKISGFHMEVRGIGIIDIASVFGAGAIRTEKHVDLVVTLKEWEKNDSIERVGIDQDHYEILGIKVPHVTIPVRTGRDLARLVEVSALDQKLRSMGHNSAAQFNQRLLSIMNDQSKANSQKSTPLAKK
ncbi:MAG: HPr(Ser) kinase/phosphatase [Chthoniobacterales bacterium]